LKEVLAKLSNVHQAIARAADVSKFQIVPVHVKY
jgi:hypothetical protein